MKPITFKHHAPLQIEDRDLRSHWIEQVVRTPEWTEPDASDPTVERRLGPIAEFGDRVLRVVVRETADDICVITANFDRRARQRRARQKL